MANVNSKDDSFDEESSSENYIEEPYDRIVEDYLYFDSESGDTIGLVQKTYKFKIELKPDGVVIHLGELVDEKFIPKESPPFLEAVYKFKVNAVMDIEDLCVDSNIESPD